MPNLTNVKLLKGSSVPVRGNGMAMVLQDGNYNISIASSTAGNGTIMGMGAGYGSIIGTYLGVANPTNQPNGYNSVGVTTDTSTSGLVADIFSGVLANYIIKY